MGGLSTLGLQAASNKRSGKKRMLFIKGVLRKSKPCVLGAKDTRICEYYKPINAAPPLQILPSA